MSSFINAPVPTSIDTLKTIVDVVPLDALGDAGTASLDVIVDAVSGAAETVADTAIVVGARGSRLVFRTARTAWNNRRGVAITAVVLGAIAGALVWRSRSSDVSAREAEAS